MLKLLDENGDGQISLMEYETYANKHQGNQGKQQEKQIETSVRGMDLNRDGFLEQVNNQSLESGNDEHKNCPEAFLSSHFFNGQTHLSRHFQPIRAIDQSKIGRVCQSEIDFSDVSSHRV